MTAEQAELASPDDIPQWHPGACDCRGCRAGRNAMAPRYRGLRTRKLWSGGP